MFVKCSPILYFASMSDLMVSRIGPISPLLLPVDNFGSTHYIVSSGYKEQKMKTLKVNRIPELETVPWAPTPM